MQTPARAETATLPSGGVIDYDYDAHGNVTAVKDGSGTVIEARTYNSDGTLASRTDRFGTVNFDAYDCDRRANVRPRREDVYRRR